MSEKRYNLLYVDDEEQNLVSFKASFRRYYNVYAAKSGQEALEILAQHEFSVIISDQRMPEMTGVELFERIREQFPDPIRMVLTGYSDIHSIIEAINKGKVYYFATKPWNPKQLKLIIDKAIEAYELFQENKSLQAEKNELLLRAERQEKEYLLSRYETLKNQVNPHFLFNSLNALASLIYDDPATAEEFIAKLTKVYRYVLEHKEAIVVSLSDEIRFMQNYVFLNQIRFGANLNLRMSIEPEKEQSFLPPLTIQLLAENAIKHNIISKEQPLEIAVYTEGNFLVVRNNLQVRIGNVSSTGIGLQNLKDRYSFLSEENPMFFVENDYYYAKIPLLEQVSDELRVPKKA